MVDAIILILLGLLASSAVIIKNKPNAKELIDKIVPIQGWLGFVACFWGVWRLISAVLGIGYLTVNPIGWIVWTAAAAVMAILGLLLGFSLLSQFVLSKNAEAMAKGEALRAKLVVFQIPVGFISIGLGIFYLVASLGVLRAMGIYVA